MKNLIITLFILLVACSPSTSEGNKDPHPSLGQLSISTKNYVIEIYDTLEINFIRSGLKAYDHNDNLRTILFSSQNHSDTVIEVNYDGEIVNRFDFTGKTEDRIGNSQFNIGYFNDSTIMVTGTRGIFFYDRKNEPVRKILDQTAVSGYGGFQDKKIRFIKSSDKELALFNLKPTIQRNFSKFRTAFFEDYTAITFYNLLDESFELGFKIPENSSYLSNEVHYGEVQTLFDIDSKNNIYVLHSPDNIIYKYDENKRPLKSLLLNHQNHKVPINYRHGQEAELEDGYQVVNSRYRQVFVKNDSLIVVYRNGLPEDEFKAIKSNSQMPKLFQDYMKYYMDIVTDDSLSTKDIRLPFPSVGVAEYMNSSKILLYTNAAVTETDSSTIFFWARLKTID